MKKETAATTLLAPVPAVMVSCGTMEKSDIVTIAWAGTINSEPPMLSISVRYSRYSYELIRETGQFVVNLVTKDLLPVCDGCGTVSGRDTDKFAKFGLTKQASAHVVAPSVAECPVSIECVVRNVVELKTHAVFIAEIVGATVREDWQDGGKVRIPDGELVAYVQNRYLATGKTLGTYGYTAKK